MGLITALFAAIMPYWRYILLAAAAYVVGWLIRKAGRSLLRSLISRINADDSSSKTKTDDTRLGDSWQPDQDEDIIEICPRCGYPRQGRSCNEC